MSIQDREGLLDPSSSSSYSTEGKTRQGFRSQRSSADIQDWLTGQIAAYTYLESSQIDVRLPFTDFGLTSVDTVSLSGDLEDWLGQQLSPTLLWEHPNIAALADALAGDIPAEPQSALFPHAVAFSDQPIAIIGIGCRFPGASDPEAFWKLLRDGRDMIREVPAERWDIDLWYDPNPQAPGKMATRWGGFLDQVDLFDPQFFKISPREAVQIDPQQRLLLEVAWHALEDAGQASERLEGSRTGVFIGIASSDYRDKVLSDPTGISAYVGTGNALSIAANRLSYFFDLHGPSIAVDTACSSSLVAVYLACQSLWRGECDQALAGGVNLILGPELTINFTKAGAMAPDGRCKTFDSRADGYVRGEGAGVVVLKPLERALADHDRIYAVVRGGAVNQDGRTNGLMAPNPQSQEAVLREAYRRAGLAPGQVDYIEAHGTGTLLGDSIEAQALGVVLADGRPTDRPCIIGSLKTNIGHLEAAAGVAGVIKVALALHHRAIPPSLHFHQPNPYIPFEQLPLRVQQHYTPWPADRRPACAGVSSFGFGGTNAHLVLEEAAPAPAPASGAGREIHALAISAHAPETLRALAGAYRDLACAADSPPLADICYSASNRRSHLDHRLALVARTPEQLAAGLDAYLHDEPFPGLVAGQAQTSPRPRVAFVFPGQGGQWIGMGRSLLSEPVFREALERCEQAFRPFVTWSLLEELERDEQTSLLDQIDVVQPTLFALQVALSELWASWGVAPDAVVGHSMGEVAAAVVAGALSLEDGARVICRRSELLRAARGRGSMALVELSREQAQQAIAGFADRIAVAVCNGPCFTVLSGDTDALEVVLEQLGRREVFHRRVKVDVASHSQQMDPLLDDLLAALDGLDPQPAATPIYSTVTAAVCDGAALTPEYWVRNLRQPVLFADTVRRLGAEGFSIFLEINAHPLLLTSIQQCAGHDGFACTTLASLERGGDEHATLLGSLGVCYAAGLPVDWRGVYPQARPPVRLPAYIWQAQRCWVETRRHRSAGAPGEHPLLGAAFCLAAQPAMRVWELVLSDATLPYLGDHRVQGAGVFPAAGYIEMAVAAASGVFGCQSPILEDMAFVQALPLHPGQRFLMQVAVTSTASGSASVQCFSRPAEDDTSGWTLHAAGSLRSEAGEQPPPCDIAALRSLYPEHVTAEAHYRLMGRHGLDYGPHFQGVVSVARRDGAALGLVRLPNAIAHEAGRYVMHPALLDACLQVMVHALPAQLQEASDAIYVPSGLRSLRLAAPGAGQEVWCMATLATPDTGAATVSGDIRIIAPDGGVVADIAGLQLQRVGAGGVAANLDAWWYTVAWERQAAQPEGWTAPQSGRGSWMIFSDGSALGQQVYDQLCEHGQICSLIRPGPAYRRQGDAQCWIDPASPSDVLRALTELERSGEGCRGIIYLWGLDAGATEQISTAALEQDQRLGCGGALTLVQMIAQMNWPLSPRLWLVTANAQALDQARPGLALSQVPLWGLGRVIAREHPELHCRMVDLESRADGRALWRELWLDDHEEQVAWRNGQRYVARLRPAPQSEAAPEAALCTVPFGTRAYTLQQATPGVLDMLELRTSQRCEPGPGEVEIQVCAAGLNFRDVLIAMDMAVGAGTDLSRLGLECAGIVARVGAGVQNLRAGDRVAAIAQGCFGAFVTTPAAYAAVIPPALSFEEAATIPIAFMTAHYALNHQGRMRPGERVLIHAAAGGVGIAAVQLVLHGGGEVFATAGSPRKRAFLQSLGVAHLMDSRSLDFADETLARTSGAGVDLVLNSLSGAALERSLHVLAPYGRFLEIGKRDIYQNMRMELWPFQKNLSYFAIDLHRMAGERQEYFGSLLREVMQLLAAGAIRPLPTHVFPVDQAADAFRFMAQARHIGKVVLSLQVPEVTVKLSVADRSTFDPQRAYLITGGLGGLGLTVARWMARRGARHLALLGRSAPGAAARAAIAELEQEGVRVLVAGADVADRGSLAAALALAGRELPPLAGVIHAAGLLDDSLVLNMRPEQLDAVMRPKVAGAWNLHTLTQGLPLDFFVLFSSGAALLGSPGQGNYAAANAFLDALAHERRARGLPGVSINWGAWSEVGLAAQPDRAGRLEQRGVRSIRPEQGVEALGLILNRPEPQIGVLPFDLPQWHRAYPAMQAVPFFSALTLGENDAAAQRDESGQQVRAALNAADPAGRQALLGALLGQYVARIVGLPPAQIDRHLALSKLGIDSLMAVEFKNRVELDLGVSIPISTLLQGPSIEQLCEYVLARFEAAAMTAGHAPAGSAPAAPPATADSPAIPVDALEGLSDEEVDRMLAALLTSQEVQS